MNEIQKTVFIILIAIGLGFLSIHKAIHIDEANFLALTKGSFGAPHNIYINWQGKSERAFDVLSNPAGIAWYLWPVRNLDPMWMRCWMLPWIIPLLWGIHLFSKEYKISSHLALVLTVFTPCVFIYHGSVMPDIPLLGLFVLGLAGVISYERKWIWALVGGCAVLFRYSALTIIPLMFILGYRTSLKKAVRLMVISSIPTLLLFVNDVRYYGEIHFLNMILFQSSLSSPVLEKFPAYMGMLSGALVFPLLPKNQKDWMIFASILGVSVGLLQNYHVSIWELTLVSLGIFSIVNTVRFYFKKDLFLCLWLLGGIFFLLQLRFAATRYWLPFFLPVLFCSVQDIKFLEKCIRIVVGLLCTIFLAYDDFAFADAHRRAAEEFGKERQGLFAGHWGWQYYLEREGWKSVEEDQQLPKTGWFAQINTAWPQEVEGCRTLEKELIFPSRSFIRVHTYEGRANFHSSALSNGSSVFVPWSFGQDPYVKAQLFQLSCP